MRARKVDQNQWDIVRRLESFPGVTVAVGHDDILVGFRGKTYWYEIKRPEEVGKNGKVRASSIKESQKKLLDTWRGHYRIVWSVDQILSEIKSVAGNRSDPA